MTRITNFGRKRTYLEAGLASDTPDNSGPSTSATPHMNASKAVISKIDSKEQQMNNNPDSALPPKKKRKRTKPSKRDGNTGVLAAKAAAEAEKAVNDGEGEGVNASASTSTPSLSKSAKKKLREKARKEKVVSASEQRRQKRVHEKAAATTCFACREKGHAAKDCPVTKSTSQGRSKTDSVVGICYRCGSTKHTLSRCKKPINQADPLPFASCFVCNGKGHLASSCPQNTAKGVYPDGGCCKLCGDNSHLARDCGFRKRDVVDTSTILGTGQEAGADEDDFHSFKRQTTEVDRDEKKEEKAKRMLEIKTGVHSGVIKPFGSVPKPSTKKVVYF